MYIGPYHFGLAPVEMFFAFIKIQDLNPLNNKLSSIKSLMLII